MAECVYEVTRELLGVVYIEVKDASTSKLCNSMLKYINKWQARRAANSKSS